MNEKYTQDFNQALKVYENKYTHDDLINILKSGTVAQKQAAALELDSVGSIEDAEILMSNLINCDGKIREAVSFRLKEFVKSKPVYFKDFAEIFLKAVIDINGNICRNTISAVTYLRDFSDFTDAFCPKLVQNTLPLIEKVKSFDIQDGKYKINKEVFKLYWYLETISEFTDCISDDNMFKILSQSMVIQDYTIREKTAKILSKLKGTRFSALNSELKKDENYYVKRALK